VQNDPVLEDRDEDEREYRQPDDQLDERLATFVAKLSAAASGLVHANDQASSLFARFSVPLIAAGGEEAHPSP